MAEKHKPTAQDIQKAEETMIDNQKTKSGTREVAFNNLKPPHFDETNGRILLDIDPALVYTDRLQQFAESQGYDRKSEFHVTIVGIPAGRDIMNALSLLTPEEKTARISRINQLIADSSWTINPDFSIYHITRDYKFTNRQTNEITTEQREALIQPLEIEGLEQFYNSLSEIAGIKITSHFPHLSLYTRGSDREKSRVGIGINSRTEFEKYKPELVKLD